KLAAHFAVTGKNELGARIEPQDGWNGLEEKIRPFLINEAAGEKDHRIQWTHVIPALDLPGIQEPFVVAGIHTIVYCANFPVRYLVHPHDLATKVIRNGDDTIRPICGGAFLIANTRRLSRTEMIAAAAVFGGMNRKNGPAMAPLLDPDQGIPGKPVMRVN